MRHLISGPCEELVPEINDEGGHSVRRCNEPGVERPDVRPDAAVAWVLCDEHHRAELLRRTPW